MDETNGVHEVEQVVVDDKEEEKTFPTFEPTFKRDILQLKHSFGYDCKRFYNLWLMDADTLVFASGNFLHYFKISTGEVTFRETVNGASIGFIAKNHSLDYPGLLTVGENGKKPIVFIYEFPSHHVRIRLRGAAKNSFTCGSYNANGDLLATQAGHPDFMLTIWRWEKAEVMLRSKAFQNDVLHVHFSAYNPILMVSCGLSHIKFWKMAKTFTGLKLKGDLGRFGKTDFSDIYAVCMLPDENVISGCEWGNMLLWEAGLIKLEVCRKGRKPCHLKAITRIKYVDGEVMTAGLDGYVRIWYWETVDLADPPDDDRFVEIEPIDEFYIPDCEIRSIIKVKHFDENHYGYYVQDGKGGIWYCDLNPGDDREEPRKLYSCHGGKVIAGQLSPVSKHLITMGEEGKIVLYDYEQKKLLLEKIFQVVGTDLLWFNTSISSNGRELMVGFEDGVIRQFFLEMLNPSDTPKMILVRAIKAHTEALTKLSVNARNTLLVTASADRTIFLYNVTEKVGGLVNPQPLGFVNFSGVPQCLNWKMEEANTLAIGCKTGEVYECKLPNRVTDEQVFLSYRLTDMVTIKSFQFTSIKSRIRRDIKRKETKRRKALKRRRKLKEIEKLKASNPGLQIDMETALADSEPEEEEEPLHIPAKPNAVLWLKYIDKTTIWISMGGYDAGYIYEVQFGFDEPVRSTMITDGDDCEIHSFLEIADFLLFGLINGKIRVNRCNPTDFRDLQDYQLFSQHDIFKGNIPKIFKSFDGQNIVTIGHDGNVFVYDWFGPRIPVAGPPVQQLARSKFDQVEDIEDPEYPSLEQNKILAEQKRQAEAAAEHDRKILQRIGELQIHFNEILRRNLDLPEELQVPHREMLLDDRVTQQIKDEAQAELDDVRDDLAYDLEVAQLGKEKLKNYFFKDLDHIPIRVTGIRENIDCYSFRMEKLGPSFMALKEEIEERLRREAAQRGPAELKLPEEQEHSMSEPGVEVFFFGRDPDTIIPRFSRKMLRILRSYRSRQLHEIERIYEWEKLHRQRPDPNKNHPDDDRKIREAERTLGDYKLKIGADYEPKPNENLTHKAVDIVKCRERLYEIQTEFNELLFNLRSQKKELYDYIAQQRNRLANLHKLMPAKNHQYLPEIPEINAGNEYPEQNLIEHFKPSCGVQIEDIIYLEKNVNDFIPKPIKKLDVETDSLLEEHEELDKYYALRVQDIDFIPEHEDLMALLAELPTPNEPEYYESNPETGDPAPFLAERRFQWILKMIEEQGTILATVETRIKNFDNALRKIANKRLYFKFEVYFIQSYMTALNQELYILRDSEEIENTLLEKAEDAMLTRNDMQTTINACNRQIEDSRRACDRINDQIAVIHLKFTSTTKNHKFFDFLRRIFRKKYKPPKPPKEGDESSESSSDDDSSSDDENADTKSVDSADMTTIRLDESTCPPGLERPMYELAFKLRSDRHALEQAFIDQQKNIENKRKEVSTLQKEMKYHEDVYDKEKKTLLEFRRKRQQELNKVKSSVVLHMNQMQHFLEGEDFRDLSNAVLFDAANLNKLKNRVSELEVESQQTKGLLRVNIVHLQRMNKDIKFMRLEIVHLEELIKQEMLKKFGIVLDLNDLEEEVLRRHVFELETNAEVDLLAIEKEIKRRQRELADCQEKLICEIRKNTEKVYVITILEEEKNFMEEVLGLQNKNLEKFFKPNSVHLDRDIEKLETIDRQQKEQIKCLEREICALRMGARPLLVDGLKDPQTETAFELLPNDDEFSKICPEIVEADDYTSRLRPDEFALARVHDIVVKCFVRHLTAHMSKDLMRKYAFKVGRYLAHAAYNFEGELTDRIFECLVDQLSVLLPKKYMLHLSSDVLSKLYKKVLAVFDYERSDVNTVDLINGIYNSAMRSVKRDNIKFNKTKYILEHIFRQLAEVLPMGEFFNDELIQALANVLSAERDFEPRCINVEGLVTYMSNYARDNLLDTIIATPIRHLATTLQNEMLSVRTGLLSPQCSIARTPSLQSSITQ